MKKYILLLILIWPSIYSKAQLPDDVIRDMKAGRIKNDTSYVYWLPYKQGKKYLFVQGANSTMSHQNELSFDFKMKKHSNICAAREGVVIETKSDSDIGGTKDEYLDDGNHIIIRHADGSTAHYWHLEKDGVLVAVGDTVQKGQHIGYSGNTGYTAFPHLHFQIINSMGKEILPRFITKKGVRYIRPGYWYKSVH